MGLDHWKEGVNLSSGLAPAGEALSIRCTSQPNLPLLR